MPILKECCECGRKGGYAEKADDEMCARCKQKNGEGEGSSEDDKD